MADSTFRGKATTEAALFLGLLLTGILVLPVAVYLLGQIVFGSYEGLGYAEFFNDLGGRLRSAEAAAWFFVLSPYLAIQALRLTVRSWRTAAGELR